MFQRHARHRVSYAVRFKTEDGSFVGEILNISRSGMLARFGDRHRRGARVVFRLRNSERWATIVRRAGRHHAGLRFDRPLTQGEYAEIVSGAVGRPRRIPRPMPEPA